MKKNLFFIQYYTIREGKDERWRNKENIMNFSKFTVYASDSELKNHMKPLLVNCTTM